jgi:tetratricopeptide (TPR) repeat protein
MGFIVTALETLDVLIEREPSYWQDKAHAMALFAELLMVSGEEDRAAELSRAVVRLVDEQLDTGESESEVLLSTPLSLIAVDSFAKGRYYDALNLFERAIGIAGRQRPKLSFAGLKVALLIRRIPVLLAVERIEEAESDLAEADLLLEGLREFSLPQIAHAELSSGIAGRSAMVAHARGRDVEAIADVDRALEYLKPVFDDPWSGSQVDGGMFALMQVCGEIAASVSELPGDEGVELLLQAIGRFNTILTLWCWSGPIEMIDSLLREQMEYIEEFASSDEFDSSGLDWRSHAVRTAAALAVMALRKGDDETARRLVNVSVAQLTALPQADADQIRSTMIRPIEDRLNEA